MTTVTTAGLDPLYNSATDQTAWIPPLDTARLIAHKALDRHASSNVHDADEVLRAAIGLEMALRSLLAALDAEEGRTP